MATTDLILRRGPLVRARSATAAAAKSGAFPAFAVSPGRLERLLGFCHVIWRLGSNRRRGGLGTKELRWKADILVRKGLRHWLRLVRRQRLGMHHRIARRGHVRRGLPGERLMSSRLGTERLRGHRGRNVDTVVVAKSARLGLGPLERPVGAVVGLPVEPALIVLLTFEAGVDDPVIVVGMLIIILSHDAIALGAGVTRQRQILVHQLLRISTHAADIGVEIVVAMAARLVRAWLAAVAASLPAFHGVRVCCGLTRMRTKFVGWANAGPLAAIALQVDGRLAALARLVAAVSHNARISEFDDAGGPLTSCGHGHLLGSAFHQSQNTTAFLPWMVFSFGLKSNTFFEASDARFSWPAAVLGGLSADHHARQPGQIGTHLEAGKTTPR